MTSNFAIHAGRVILASLFILGGLKKIVDAELTRSRIVEAGLPMPEVLVALVIALELGGGLIVALLPRIAAYAAIALVAFTVLVNAMFHPFWAMSGEIAALELSLFFKNVSIIGGLVLIAGLNWPNSSGSRASGRRPANQTPT